MTRYFFNLSLQLCTVVMLLVIIGLLALPENCQGWGVLAPSQTHQHILKEAYRLLEAEPGFDPKAFPKLEAILAHEGVNWANIGFTGQGTSGVDISLIDGPGPDAKGNSPFSMHYYNPAAQEGGAPQATASYYKYLAEGMRTNKVEALPKSAAWSAHFLADMYCPYHVNGVSRSTIERIASEQKNKHRGTTLDGAVFLSDTVTGNDALSYAAPLKSLTKDFKNDVERFLSTTEDWFDPWYYNGTTAMLMSNTSSHIAWEGTIQPGSYNLSGYNPAWKNGTPDFVNPVMSQASQASQLAIDAATLTQSKLYYFFYVPETAINQAIRSAYTLWRASFSAMKIKIQTKKEGDIELVTAKVTNLNTTPFDNVKIKLQSSGCELISKNQIQSLGTLPPKGELSTLEWKVKTSSAVCRLTTEAIGSSATPDLQYARLEMQPEQSLTIIPSKAVVLKKDAQLFKAVLAGKESKEIIWSVKNGVSGGTIDADGLYKPPAASGNFTVIAKSKKDKNLTGEATVIVPGLFLETTVTISNPGIAVPFTAKTTNAPLTAGYAWQFGDGTASVDTTAPSVSHVYQKVGNYQAIVRLSDLSSGKVLDEATGSVKIEAGLNLLRHVEYWDTAKTKIKLEYTYYLKGANRVLHGIYRSYNEEGKSREAGNYSDGQRSGAWNTTDYFQNKTLPQKSRTYSYVEPGKKAVGSIKENHENGRLYREYGFILKDNSTETMSGPYVCYWSNGTMTERGTNDSDGKKTGLWEGWNENGKPTYTNNYTSDERTYWSYYDNGKIKDFSSYVKDKKVGLEERYYESGQIYYRGTYSNGVQEGKETYWHDNGNRSSEATFSAGNANGVRTLWDKNGKVWAVDNYKNGKQHGLDTQYYPNGNKRWELVYDMGKTLEETKWNEQGGITYHKKW
ncbi:Antitoxin component YwqK of the YwqJK toxin-antitoxin module [Trichlorobacter thiogenes]|uniref:Antitoxin component YwqK of the YwqJK toxin-antitoxin module n=1 Tax=Trichlorobacter thiogenes TaxID=115783 RepID=A0A1T4NWA2_9BACT|nr:PKD domain-containing protein [Trichlorobacter thiogenes]SJZ83503.1 Antitoxin component YwqK of the YwqJK toxin-antitoxin module [Trichlorobacter thiogenes]